MQWVRIHVAVTHTHAYACVLSCFSHVLTLCDPVESSLLGSSVHGILQARLLEWAAMPSFRGSSQPRDRTCGFCIAGGFFTTEPLGKPCIYVYIYI